MAPAGSPASDPPELVPEPVTGWRMWRLHRGPEGELILRSVFEREAWPPRAPLRARCGRTWPPSPRPHPVPDERCGCGIYAAASYAGLRRAGLPGEGAHGVLGTVSMWGRVVEHAGGFRSELAYPARLRLVCARCVALGRTPIPEVVVEQSDALVPVCRRHERFVKGRRAGIGAAELQSALLSTYAVDLLPMEEVRIPLAARIPDPVRALGRQAHLEARALARSWVGWAGLAVVALVSWAGCRGG